jgi:hypothetical protein
MIYQIYHEDCPEHSPREHHVYENQTRRFALKAKSEQLLETAKRAVEIAIET